MPPWKFVVPAAGSTCNINDDCIYDLNVVHDDMEPDDCRYRTLLDTVNNGSYIKNKFDGSLHFIIL